MLSNLLELVSVAAIAAFAAVPPAATSVRFRIEVPKTTPADAVVHLAGSSSALGGWKADGVRLARDGEHWTAVVELPPGRVEWKATLGTWERCEVLADGSERPNRVVEVGAEPLLVEAVVALWRTPPASTATGDIRVLGPVPSQSDRIEGRPIQVRVPADYDRPEAKDRRHRVVYMLDGQNVFDAATSFAGVEWRADETVDALLAAGAIEPVIVVAIPNSPRRMDEMTFDRDVARGAGGDGDQFLAWILDDVKPLVDSTYRTLSDRDGTILVGSSLGGLFALEAVARRSDRIGRAIAMSPSFWWADEAFLKRSTGSDARRPEPIALWIDTGTDEARNAPDGHVDRARRFGRIFEGVPTVRTMIVDGGRHHESAWAARLGDALRFVLPRPKSTSKPDGKVDRPPQR
jgi:predicted alpha/beta superfamily hydrolase